MREEIEAVRVGQCFVEMLRLSEMQKILSPHIANSKAGLLLTCAVCEVSTYLWASLSRLMV